MIDLFRFAKACLTKKKEAESLENNNFRTAFGMA